MDDTPDKTAITPAAAAASDTPAWAAGASRLTAFLKGARALYHVPGIVLFCTAMGYGAFARDGGLTLGQTMFVSASIFALPGQVVLVDQLARGATLAAAAFAVMLTAIRLLPMTVVMVPFLRDPRSPRWALYLGAHFIAITAYMEGMRTLPQLPGHLCLPHHIGVGAALVTSVTTASLVGYLIAGAVPPIVSAALLFMTPIYFAVSLLQTAVIRADRLALGLGAVLGPLAFLLMPGLDLLLTGVVGGTLAYLLDRHLAPGGGRR